MASLWDVSPCMRPFLCGTSLQISSRAADSGTLSCASLAARFSFLVVNTTLLILCYKASINNTARTREGLTNRLVYGNGTEKLLANLEALIARQAQIFTIFPKILQAILRFS